MITDVRELLRLLVSADRRAAVWCACRCARTVLHLVPEGEHRPKRAIERSEGWARGKTTAEACWDAGARATEVPSDWGAPAGLIANAAFRIAADTISGTPDEAGEAIAEAVSSIANATGTGRRNMRQRSERHLEVLLELVSAERWPRIVPNADQIREAPEALRVAWDLVAQDDHPDHTVPELVEAHARAERLDLDWSDPVQRAIAERAPDEVRIRQLLAVGQRGEAR